MNYLTLAQFKTVLADFGGTADLDPVYTRALDAAEAEVDRIVGFDVFVEFCDVGNVPADLQSAGYMLAMIEAEAMDPARKQQVRARAESLLRQQSREKGFAGSEVTP